MDDISLMAIIKGRLRSGTLVIPLIFVLEDLRDSASMCKKFASIHAKGQVLRTRLFRTEERGTRSYVALKTLIEGHDAIIIEKCLAKDSSLQLGYK